MKKKTIHITLILCTCFIYTIKGAEASALVHIFKTQQTNLTVTLENNTHLPVHKITSSSPLWFTKVNKRIKLGMPTKKGSQEEKDRNFVQNVRYVLAIGEYGGIIYYFSEKPTPIDLEELIRQFPYAKVLFIDYKDKDSYCVSFQPPSPRDKRVKHELTLENMNTFLSTVEAYRSTQKK